MFDESPYLTPAEQSTWQALMLFTQLLDGALDRQLRRDSDMPHTYYTALLLLANAPEQSARISVLARALHYSPSRMTHALKSMARSGFLTSRASPDDGRGQIVTLTDHGAEALRAAMPGHIALVRSLVFSRLDARQVTQLRKICETLLEGLKEDAFPRRDEPPSRAALDDERTGPSDR